MALDLEHIEATEDRSFTFALIARLGEPGVLPVLLALDDPRARVPLQRLLEDPSRDPVKREAAGTILLASAEGVHRQDALRWWTTGDELLRGQALLAMGHEDGAIVVAVAADPHHPLHRQAIETMEWGFEAPRYQALKIAALDHHDPKVRVAAAEVLLWDEPVAAEQPLLRSAEDADPDVACAALDALRYYPTRGCVARVEALRNSPVERIHEAVEKTLADLRDTMSPPESRYAHEARAPRQALREVVAADLLIRELSDPDGPWKERKARLGRLDWSAFGPARSRLTEYLLVHPDPWVRAEACFGFAAWQEHSTLFKVLQDPAYSVMKSAAYALGLATPDANAAAELRAHLDVPRVTSTHARETLEAWVHHAGGAAIPDLVGLARDDERESVRVAAIRSLCKLSAHRELESLLPILASKPSVTWSVHIALLAACTTFNLEPPGLAVLRAVDNYWVEIALDEFDRGVHR